jgi:RNA polymerase sigma factor (sigma-70 family)
VLDEATVRALVAAAGDGDRSAWNALVDAYSGLVWTVIRGHGLYDADAADVAQTVWLRFVEHVGRLREPERVGAWLATTARHECYRVLRKRGRSVVMADPPEVPDVKAEALEGKLLADESRHELLAALSRVPERCQTLLRLMLADPPLSYDEIADVLSMPKGSIGPTRMRCLDHVRAAMRNAA